MKDKQPKKYPIRPNVVIGLGVFTAIILGATAVSIIDPESLPGMELKDIIITALAILAALFQNLIGGEDGKDTSMSDLAQALVKNGNGNGNGHHAPLALPKPEPKHPVDIALENAPVEKRRVSEERVKLWEESERDPNPVSAADMRKELFDKIEPEEKFNNAFLRTLKHEGEWLLSKEPDGIRVYSGINEKANPNWEGWEFLPQAPEVGNICVNKRELRELTKERYRENYWNHKMVQAFADYPDLQQQVFDCHVHGGCAWRLQEACLKLNIQCDKDGLWGPGTKDACLKALGAYSELEFNNALVECRHEYIGRAVRKKLFTKNIAKGLRARAISFTLA